MSSPRSKKLPERRPDSRAPLCLFTFADGRRCRMPHSGQQPYLCAYHARREAHALAGEQVGRDIARFLIGHYVTANDVMAALARLFVAVAQGRLKPRTAATLAYLGQTLTQTLPLAQHEFINAYGASCWRGTVQDFFDPPARAPVCSTPASTPPGEENRALQNQS